MAHGGDQTFNSLVSLSGGPAFLDAARASAGGRIQALQGYSCTPPHLCQCSLAVLGWCTWGK